MPTIDKNRTRGALASVPVLPVPVLPVLAIVLAKTAVQLSVAGRYGWHRDELYYRSAGEHLALGYVDFPPVVPLLVRLAAGLFGDSLVGLRSLAALAGAAVVVLTALLARELGGGRRAQVVAAVAAAASPLLLGGNSMFQTVSFDHLTWAGVLVLVVRLLRTGDVRLWPAIGVAAGVGLMTKYTVAVLLVGLVAGLAATTRGRELLRTPGPWVAAALAGAILAPNLWWQARHGWPSVEFFRGQNAGVREETSVLVFTGELVLLAGLPGLVLAIAGLRRLAADVRWRPLGWAAALVVVAFLVLGGKSYYAGPALPLLFAAGACSIELAGRRVQRATPWAVVAFAVVGSPAILPVLPVAAMVDLGLAEAREDYAEELGWPELAATVAGAYRDLSPGEQASTAIVAWNYGEAGALGLHGPALGLPEVVSGHLSHRYWAPAEPSATTLLVVGFDPMASGIACRSVEVVATLDNDAGADNEERGRPVSVCGLDGDLGDAWPAIAGRGRKAP